MGLITLALCVSRLVSLVYANRYSNPEHQNDLHENLRQLFLDFAGNEEREEFVPESGLSRHHPERRSVSPSDPSSNLKLAAFNVQTFGTKKMATPGVPELLVKIILRYDLILIQEIRDSSGTAIKHLLSRVNKASTTGLYDITISPRLGRTSSKEQYAFLYKKDLLSVRRSYVYDDGQESLKNDTFEREPYIVQFTSTRTKIKDLVLVAIHTSPSNAPQEIDELASVYDDVIRKLGVRDVIILGDFNAACSYMSDSDWQKNRLANDKRFHWLISDCVDTSLAGFHCAYDRFVVAGDAMLEVAVDSSAGIFEFDKAFDVNKILASRVSDHYPIELQLYSKSMSTAISRVSTAVQYTFKMKKPVSLSSRTIYRLRKKLVASGFTLNTTYSKTGGMSLLTFSRPFGKKQEAATAISYIRKIALTAKLVSLEQIQMAEFQIKGPWDKGEILSANGDVKLVCEIKPSPNCWIAIQVN